MALVVVGISLYRVLYEVKGLWMPYRRGVYHTILILVFPDVKVEGWEVTLEERRMYRELAEQRGVPDRSGARIQVKLEMKRLQIRELELRA